MRSAICSLTGAVFLFILAAPAMPATLARAPVVHPAPHLAMLPPRAQAWLRQEAAREAAANIVSEGTALAAVQNSGVNFGAMPIEDAVMLMFMLVAQDADQDMQQMLSQMQQANQQKQALRRAQQQMKASQNALAGQARQEYGALQSHRMMAPSVTLNDYLASRKVSLESLGDLSEVQQLKLQQLADQRAKALETISNIMKREADTRKGIIDNMK